MINRAEDIAAEIVRRVGALRAASGAETDIGARVYQGRRYIDREMTPCCVVIEGDDIPDRKTARTDYSIEQRYMVAGYAACDPDDPNTTGHAIVRDIKRALFITDGKPSEDWGRRVGEVKYLGRGMGPLADGESFVVAIVEISVRFVENLATP